jgi:hypothetical protein
MNDFEFNGSGRPRGNEGTNPEESERVRYLYESIERGTRLSFPDFLKLSLRISPTPPVKSRVSLSNREREAIARYASGVNRQRQRKWERLTRLTLIAMPLGSSLYLTYPTLARTLHFPETLSPVWFLGSSLAIVSFLGFLAIGSVVEPYRRRNAARAGAFIESRGRESVTENTAL